MIRRVLVGPTASGKKSVAVALAERHGLTLLSMDSMKVYRGMDVGTDKPDAQQRRRADWRLLDLVGHDARFSAGDWVRAAQGAASDATGPVLFTGGTPLYLRLLVRGLFSGPPSDPRVRAELQALWDAEGEDVVRARLAAVDPVLEARLLPGDRKRLVRALEVHQQTGRPLSEWQRDETRPPIEGRFLLAALRHPVPLQRERIAARVERMLERGLIDEVGRLLARAPFAAEPGRAIGYAEALDLRAGRIDREEMAARIIRRTRRLVRKQRTFLASFPGLHWIDVPAGGDPLAVLPQVEVALELGG